jgi:hypothetical protein
MTRRLGWGWAPFPWLGSRSLPLIRVHLSDVASIDGHAEVTFDSELRVRETHLLGASFIW